MNGYLVLLIIVTIVAICALIYFNAHTKIKKYNIKIMKAEEKINGSINKKNDLIKLIAKVVKKVTKKDYLKDYIEIEKEELDNIEFDYKLGEAEKLFNDLLRDYSTLRKNKDSKKYVDELREINEILVSSKDIYNTNSESLNKLIKRIPNNIIAKIMKVDIKQYYHNIKTDDNETLI